jgi:hypothetical protein
VLSARLFVCVCGCDVWTDDSQESRNSGGIYVCGGGVTESLGT